MPVGDVPLKPTELTPAVADLGWRRWAVEAPEATVAVAVGLSCMVPARGLLTAHLMLPDAAPQQPRGAVLLALLQDGAADSLHLARRPEDSQARLAAALPRGRGGGGREGMSSRPLAPSRAALPARSPPVTRSSPPIHPAMACRSFFAVASRLIVGPILKTLVFSTTPEATRQWVDAICRDWDFRRIIPAHFTAPVPATPADLRAAFSFVYPAEAAPAPAGLLGLLLGQRQQGGAGRGGVQYPEEDMQALNTARRFLVDAGVVKRT